jgi:hypothetical protein
VGGKNRGPFLADTSGPQEETYCFEHGRGRLGSLVACVTGPTLPVCGISPLHRWQCNLWYRQECKQPFTGGTLLFSVRLSAKRPRLRNFKEEAYNRQSQRGIKMRNIALLTCVGFCALIAGAQNPNSGSQSADPNAAIAAVHRTPKKDVASKVDPARVQTLPSLAESVIVQLEGSYAAPQGCVLLVTGSSGGTTICPKVDTGTTAKSGVLTDPQPCSLHFGTADASINRTRYCTDVARETPE